MEKTPPDCDTLIFASRLMTQNEERAVLENAALCVRQGVIQGLGPREDFASVRAAQTLDLGEALLLPGLINAHTHSAMTFLRGLADDLPLMIWLRRHVFPLEKKLSEEIIFLGCLLGCAEMTRSGTTAFADMYLLENAVMRAVEQCGLRVLAGEGIFAFPSPAYSEPEAALNLVRAQAARWQGHSRIRVGVMPHSVYTTTPALLGACRDLAGELHLPLHIHLAETPEETADCLAATGRRPVPYCHALGLLGKGSTIAHGVDLTDEDMDLLAQTGTRVVHNPRSNMKLASGVAPIPDLLARGVVVGLGTDGAASNNSLNLFAEMSACALLHKVSRRDPTVMPARTVLDRATLGSAAALDWTGLGVLAPGRPADLIALDLSSPNLQPVYNPASQLVYAASGLEVVFSMVEGRVLYHNGRFSGLDYPLLLREMEKVKAWVLQAYN
ncbi:MAG: amidohydrolase [Deltaproteobacteria bacterium]|jgi:5-methylthioadenosine/S-adenosylhomocysteine deaminase|nr:amidohydrolase [Deltaproteobacteria bacterium]